MFCYIVLIGVGFDLGSIYVVMLQLNIPGLGQIQQHFGKCLLDLPLQAVTAKVIDGAKVGQCSP